MAKQSKKISNTNKRGPIVSSSHLAQSSVPELSEIEFAMGIAMHAFQRWSVRGMAASGVPDLSPLDVQVLHVVNHRGRAKRLADICLMLNLEETHTVVYALKKLEKSGFINSSRKGKEKYAEATVEGEQVCERYREIREQCLIEALETLNIDKDDMSRLAGLLRALSGLYDQAARSAASL